MYTDWVLIQRVALELTRRFSGARLQAVGNLPDGRFALQMWQRGATGLIAFDVYASTPVVTLETMELAIEAEPGFIRRAGAALRGMTLDTVRSRKGDRVLRFDFGARSRFGVQSGYSLIAELVPRFGNLLLLKDETIVGALKEFSPAENAQRSVQAGDVYEPPPLSTSKHESDAELVHLLNARGSQAVPDRAVMAAFRALFPLLPQMVALSLLTAAYGDQSGTGAVMAAELTDQAEAFAASLAHLAELPVIEYREGARLVQAHVAHLHQFAHLAQTKSLELLPLLAESRAGAGGNQQTDRIEKRRRALSRILKEREGKLRKDLADVESGLRRSDKREQLREEGEAIYATLHEQPDPEREDAKSRAATLFEKYRKFTTSIPHLRSRHDELARGLGAVHELQWELERSGDADLEDVASAVEQLDGRAKRPAAPRTAPKKRKPLSLTTQTGSRILIGRSPVENAELTFRVARPDDLWFHAQKIPGAHVILQRDDREVPSDADLLLAASFAAFFSKAKNSPAVVVDYTQRKHVRKQPAAPPGLVFYTHPKSLTVQPKEPPV